MTTLADLLVRAHLHRPSLADSAHHSMSKAVRRVAEAAGQPPQDVDAEDIREAHAALDGKLSIGGKQFREEQTNLIRLLALPAVPEDLSRRIFCGKATLADAIAAVELQAPLDKWKAVEGCRPG